MATSLRPLMLEGEALAAARERAGRLPAVQVTSREAGDIVMLGIGGFTPLAGFMGEADWRGVCDGMRTADGLFWPIPITLSVDAGTAGGIGTGDEIALAGPGDPAPMAILRSRRSTPSTRPTSAARSSAPPTPSIPE